MSKGHGHCKNGKLSKTYVSWYSMIRRCTNPKHQHYKYYGGRGITVCENWKSFKVFLEDMGERPAKMTLDRKDNNGNYCKSNCKWSTQKEQTKNRRSGVSGGSGLKIKYGDISQTAREWATMLDIKLYTLRYRLRNGWTIERMINYQKYKLV